MSEKEWKLNKASPAPRTWPAAQTTGGGLPPGRLETQPAGIFKTCPRFSAPIRGMQLLSCGLLPQVLSPWDFFLLLCSEPQAPDLTGGPETERRSRALPRKPYVPPKSCSPRQGSGTHWFTLRTAGVHDKSQQVSPCSESSQSLRFVITAERQGC